MPTRRELLIGGAALTGAALSRAGGARAEAHPDGGELARWEPSYSGGAADRAPLAPGKPGADYAPVVVPDGATLPFHIVDGVKVFHLVIDELRHEFAPGLTATCWGYNGQVSSLT